MTVQNLTLELEGLAPLLLHNGVLADPLSKFSKALKAVSGKRKKTDADHEEMGRIEFMGSLYMCDGVPVMPAGNIEACLIEGAKKVRRGKDAKAGLWCLQHARLEYEGPKDAEGLWADESYRLRVGVNVSQAKVMRTRPIFKQWALSAELEFEDEVFSEEEVVDFAKRSGTLCGLGDWRPKYGRFRVV